jgi:pteridine reductase
MDLTGRLALVTGAGIRLGRALAEGLADRGARVALHYHEHQAEAEQLADRVTAARIGQPMGAAPVAGCFSADLGDPASISSFCREVESAMGQVDVLVLSAAIYPREPLEAITPVSLERTLRVNLTSPLLLACEMGRLMKSRGIGHIVALLDWSLDRPYPDRIPYTAAKAGLRAGIFGLARALAPEVRVNAIAPGAVLLPEGMDAVQAERIRAATPLGRIGHPRDVVGAALYLLESEFITGTILTVDGGRSVA